MNFVKATEGKISCSFYLLFTFVLFCSSCSKCFIDVFEIHSLFILFQMYYKKCNPECNGVMLIRFRYVLSRLSETFLPFIQPPSPLPPPPDISPASFISSPKTPSEVL